MWYQIWYRDEYGNRDATPLTMPLKELDLLSEIKFLAKHGVKYPELYIQTFKHTIKEKMELDGLI